MLTRKWRIGDRVTVHRVQLDNKTERRVHRRNGGKIVSRHEILLDNGELLNRQYNVFTMEREPPALTEQICVCHDKLRDVRRRIFIVLADEEIDDTVRVEKIADLCEEEEEWRCNIHVRNDLADQ